jgi:NAD(P)-dependent dehydrogenase (short-subunit alcohol dehydrogenase family)
VTGWRSPERILRQLKSGVRYGKVDVLINNAAFQRAKQQVQEFSPDEIKHTFRTNIEAMFFLSRVAAPKMKPGAGPVWTPLIPSTMSPEKASQFGAKTPPVATGAELKRPRWPGSDLPNVHRLRTLRDSEAISGAK